ncbi:MAG: alpha/beta hydrolase [Clostridia bacterium]|nr:alpha/beta hydrolase [Clostridia bacterium]
MLFLWIGLGVIGFLLLAVLITSIVCYFRMFYSPPRKALGQDEYAIPDGEIYEVFREDMIAWTKMIRAYPYKEYAIESFDGLTLRAKFFEYEPGAPIELMFHGYKGNAERDLNGGVERCFQLGHSALLIDHRASGFSDGHTITFGILERRDCLAWVDFAVKEFGENAKLILTGISMGAATVMMAAGYPAAGNPLPPQVKYVLADCGYTSPKEIISKVMREMKLPPALLYPCATLGAWLFGHFNLNEDSPMEAMKRCKIPVVFAHGDTDDFVPYDMSVRLCEICASEHKKLVTVPGAGHGLAFPVGRDAYVNALKEFKRECGFDF